ncbi:MAG: ornithine cyclodeaminase family protein [Ardenticatenaceae bacterium]|nr:ornithine cyclodeaminase family protein [Ardenticatenaceae bacterium]
MGNNQLLYLSQAEVAAVGLSMAEIIDAVEAAFGEKGHGRVEMPPKPGVHPGGGDNFIHAMPAYIPGLKSAGVKWVSGYPENQKRGLPYITGLLIYNDVDTGIPLAVMDCVWITAMRTAAASVVGAKYLARPESSTLGILGCGVQGRSHIEAFNVAFPLQKVMAYDVDTAVAQKFAAEMNEQIGLDVAVVSTPREAVSGCDLVVTAGPILKHPHQTIKAGWLDEGAFASLVDFDSYWHPDAMMEAAKFCTDDVPQLRHYQSAGYFQQIPAIHGDLGELVTGQKSGRETVAERTMTANLGLAMDDMAVAPLIYQRAVEKGMGTWLPL